MTEADKAFIAVLCRLIEDVISGNIRTTALSADHATPELSELAVVMERLLVNLEGMQRFSVALANGEITAAAPPRMPLLGPLKSLQASLRHLTWQTQEVAAGHLDHRVDFLGEFSVAFNQMVASLQMKQRAEQEAMEATRLAGIGQLAAGIAHEINTPLQYIGTNLEYISDNLREWQAVSNRLLVAPAGDQDSGNIPASSANPLQEELAALADSSPIEEMQAALQDIVQGVGGIAKIVNAVKKFTAEGGTAKVLVDINAVIENTVEVSRNAWSHCAECTLTLAPRLPQVLCRVDDIKQVLLNLILNAAQAIEESRKTLPGKIEVSSCLENDRVVVRIADSGTGIPEKIRKQIFNLFFTTREVGKGTGLGLALVHDLIVSKHGGSIEVGGKEGKGAIFIFRLPVIV